MRPQNSFRPETLKIAIQAELGLSRSLLYGFNAKKQFEGKRPNQARCPIREQDGDRLQEASGKFQLSLC
jgi:hypothetical protein